MIDSFHRRWVARIGREMAIDTTAPLQSFSEGVYDGGRNFFSVIPDLFRARAENVALRKRVGELEQQLTRLREQLLLGQRLAELDKFSSQFDSPKLIARVIGKNPGGWSSTILVDKGNRDGVERHQPVLSSQGLVGHVVEVFHSSCKVLLLTDPNCKVAVIVQEGRAQGVVQGDSEEGCVLKYVEHTADIKKGDIVITSGNSAIYPKGLLVGRIEDVKNTSGALFQWARVAPETDLRKLEEVTILTGARPSDESSGAENLSLSETIPSSTESN